MGVLLEGGMDYMALIGVHGLQGYVFPVTHHFASYLQGQILQTLLALFPVVLRVYVDTHTLVTAPVHRVVGELLDGVQRLAPAADELAQLFTL